MPRRRRMSAGGADDDALGPALTRPRLERGHLDTGSTSVALGQEQLSYDDYTVGWLCALPLEAAAAVAMLDKLHPDLPKVHSDSNKYTLGSIGLHNVVIACLPSGHYGTVNAAVVATNMTRSFPSISIKLMVGIGGGVPAQHDVRLGDVVVGHKVVQFDYGKTTSGGEFHMTSEPVRPPQALAIAASYLQSRHQSGPSKIPMLLSEMLNRNPTMKHYSYPYLSSDRLFDATYEHEQEVTHCDSCDQSRLVSRTARAGHDPVIHYGTVASGNQVVKHAKSRDKWAARVDAICFEMEAAGLVDHFQCLVIRGICDYCDSHKNKEWQPYAAATSAAFAKELLTVMDAEPSRSMACHPVTFRGQIPGRKSEEEIRQHRDDIIESLRFNQMDARRQTIRKPHAQTCQWFLQQRSFLDWSDPAKLSQHGGFLWIKGKPGAGKSTLMKFIHDQARRSSQDSNVVLDFFFNARGVSLEKSTLGMYRSILLQLLTTLPHLQNHLDSVPLPRDGQWSILVLVDLFEQIVQHLEHSSVTVYIDALDECDQDEIRDMIYDFDRVGQLAISSGSTLKICYASRHYPHITLREGLGLEVFLESEKDHTADITAYINSKLTIGQSKLASEIRAELKAKASGVFMWVVLVVQILNKERDRGNMHSLRQKLREIPGDLHKLFQEILAQEQDKEELLLCIQWVLFAETPFTPRELYSAILYTENISTNDVLEEDVHIFITNYSKGLVEITRSRHPTVQFIHESVRDFLLRNDGVRIIWPSLSTGFIADSHMRLAHCCLEYCKIIDTDNVPIPTIQYDYTRGMIPWRDKSSFDDSRKWMEAAFPFLYRAVRSSLFHADEACTHGTLSSDFIHSFQLMLNRWVHLYNLTAISPDQEYLPSTPLLYILASEDRPYLIKATSRALELVDVNDEDDFGCPLLAAIYWENSKAIEAFRECLVSHNQIHGREAKEFRNHEERCSIEFGQKFRSSKRSVLSFLAEHGDTHLLESLILSEKLNINIQMEQDGTEPVVVAAHRGNRAMVKFLIGTGLFDLNSKDQYGRTPLTVASTQGHEAIVRVLLASKLVDPNVMDGQGISSFSRAIRNDHDAVAQILLETGQVNVDETDSNGRTHLSRTAQRGYDPMMECLLGIGQANPDLADLSGRTPLSWAAQCARIPVITRLLNTGRVNPDSRDNNGRTPLSWAAQNSYLAVVRCLLETGRVDPNSCDINGETPASWARRSGRTIIADYILAAVRV